MTATVTSPFIIAELGTAHGGSIVKAKELVDAAVSSGADCVKFQIVYADEILHPNTGLVPLPGGDTRLYDVFKKLEVPPAFLFLPKTNSLHSHKPLRLMGGMPLMCGCTQIRWV